MLQLAQLRSILARGDSVSELLPSHLQILTSLAPAGMVTNREQFGLGSNFTTRSSTYHSSVQAQMFTFAFVGAGLAAESELVNLHARYGRQRRELASKA